MEITRKQRDGFFIAGLVLIGGGVAFGFVSQWKLPWQHDAPIPPVNHKAPPAAALSAVQPVQHPASRQSRRQTATSPVLDAPPSLEMPPDIHTALTNPPSSPSQPTPAAPDVGCASNRTLITIDVVRNTLIVPPQSPASAQMDKSLKAILDRTTGIAQPVAHKPSQVDPPIVAEKFNPSYTPQARQFGVAGMVTILVDVDETGKPINPCVYRAVLSNGQQQRLMGYGLDEEAIKASLLWRFHPARRDGIPTVMTASIEMTFGQQ